MWGQLSCATCGRASVRIMRKETNSQLRILAIHRYYWPDSPPYASMLRSIVSTWVDDGHEVEVFSTQPSYKPGAINTKRDRVEIIDGARVQRIRLPLEFRGKKLRRIINLLRFICSIMLFIFKRPKFDVIMASTAPPVFVGVAARIGAALTGAKFVYHCMDLHPEIGRLSGEFKNNAVYKLLLSLDAKNCAKSAKVVVLSEDMKRAVLARPNCQNADIEIINNFALPIFEDETSIPREMLKSNEVFRLLFAGNIGNFQGLEYFIEAMHTIKNPSIELVFVGEGKGKAELQSKAGKLLHSSVKFFPHQSVYVAKNLMKDADVCIVSLIPNVIQYAYPSKVLTYLESKKPILAAIEIDSELGSLIKEQQIGLCVEQGDAKSIARGIQSIACHENYKTIVQNVENLQSKLFLSSDKLSRWSSLVKEITHG